MINDLLGYLAVALVGLLAWWGNGKFQERKGRLKAENDVKLKQAQDRAEAHEVRNEVENRIADERDARERLRRDWSG